MSISMWFELSVTEKNSTVKEGEVESDNHPTSAVKRKLFPHESMYGLITPDELGTAKID